MQVYVESMEIRERCSLDAPIERVWKILAEDYGDVGRWTRVIKNSTPLKGETIGRAPCYGRVCDTADGVFKERIIEFDAQTRTLAYAVEEGLPFFVRSGVNRWTLERTSDTTTEAQMLLRFEMPAFFEWTFGRLMGGRMRKTVLTFLEDLRHYAQTGAPLKAAA